MQHMWTEIIQEWMNLYEYDIFPIPMLEKYLPCPEHYQGIKRTFYATIGKYQNLSV